MSMTGSSATPSPLRDSPNPGQLQRDQDGELWDALANVIYHYDIPDFTDINPVGGFSFIYVDFTAPVQFKYQAHAKVQCIWDGTDNALIRLKATMIHPGDPVTGLTELDAIISPPTGGNTGASVQGDLVGVLPAGRWRFYAEADNDSAVQIVSMGLLAAHVRRGRPPA